MYLKTLTLRGFKSFASATTLQFEPGVTCVVGPNGSGKSNVVDALAWVMGEQGAKTLRGGKMEDVIFAGTAGRAPLGRAEVSLTIDNGDGALPIDFAEVTISRTLFRNGGSEYAINGSPCRLLDVQELLSDTGMGRQMHVIVGQGQLDAILRATPEERRGFIEEAAGVLKHRRRKEKALRKLDSMAAHLTRLQDLTAEVRRQLGPLAKQAQVARKATLIQADLRDAAARLLADDLAQVMASHAREEADLAEFERQRREVAADLDALETEIQQARERISRAAPEADAAAETWYRLSSVRERLRALRALAVQRVQLLSEVKPESLGTDPQDLVDQSERVRAAERALGIEVAEAEETVRIAAAATAAAETLARATSQELRDLQRAIADRREGVAKLAGAVDTHRGRLESAQAEIAADDQRLAALAASISSLEREYRAVEMEVADVEAGEVDLDEAYERASSELDRAKAVRNQYAAEIRECEREVASTRARREALDMALTRRDGAGALLAEESGDLVLGSLAAAISITAGYEAAVNAALGTYADAVIVADAQRATAALAWLRLEEAGRSAIIIDDGGPSAEPPASVAGTALLDVVAPADHVRAALTALLADVVVTQDMDEARQVLAEHPQVRVVTMQGDLLSTTHAWGGSESAPSVLQLQAEFDATNRRLDETERRLAALVERKNEADRAVAANQSAYDIALSTLHESDAKISGVAARLARLGEQIRTAKAGVADRTKARETRIAQIEILNAALRGAEERLAAADLDPRESNDRIDQLGRRAAELERDLAAARASETEAKLVLRTSQERARALAGKADSLLRAADKEQARRREMRAQAAARESGIARAHEVVDGVDMTLQRIEGSLEQAAQVRDALQSERKKLDADVIALQQRKEELRTRGARIIDRAHREEIAQAQRQAQLAQVRARAGDELGIDPDVLIEEYGPHVPVPTPAPTDDDPDALASRPYVRAEQEKRLKAAQRAMTLLGRVNPLAMEEHAALDERHRFLTEQLADLKRSRADLLHIVAEVDERVERVFTEAFADMQEQFAHVFSRLFPGGEGKLVLTDPTDMLATGIEVEARPAGKKVKRLSLLSGGERSLAAIAMLVAIFKARPSPFYVMDEVEAALDDVNLGRLLGIFRELQHDSQLIVITHQKRTMEIADALYGVTMRGDGVTTVISQKLTEAAE
ncbi:chromosome segregation protein SMC [Rarobacter incanus]|uniref:Chromosome partition protein Smc n=1 Tax=Rarobacter incanus TaxID=153494 RepID=A0A542SMD0_9MICO|nr:chromosome segregation protein SMC [Rarobacter incanus]TQK75407.1 condensin subunit Smc [Rarobacter incanus]